MTIYRRTFLGSLVPSSLFFVPIIVLIGLSGVFLSSLGRDPEVLPSTLIGKAAPTFTLPPVQGRSRGFASSDLQGGISLVNVFASWCAACRAEHPLLMNLRKQGFQSIYGLDYKDPPKAAAQWLLELGDPYLATGADLDGRVSIDWGVYGIPETFVISPQGTILYRHVGSLTADFLNKAMSLSSKSEGMRSNWR